MSTLPFSARYLQFVYKHAPKLLLIVTVLTLISSLRNIRLIHSNKKMISNFTIMSYFSHFKSRYHFFRTVTTVPPPLTTPKPTIKAGRDNFTLLVHFHGRLGNNLFQYAATLGLADMTNRTPMVINDRTFHWAFPNVTSKLVENQGIYVKNNNKDLTSYSEPISDGLMYSEKMVQILKNSKNKAAIVWGYTQSFKYFEHIKDVVLQELTFSNKIIQKVDKILTSLRQNVTTLIGIHARRGDMPYLEGKGKFGYMPATKEYLEKAMAYAAQLYANQTFRFVIVSDTMSWCKETLKKTKYLVSFVEGNVPPEDMCLISRCDQVIMTVGTFGWWAGYLNRGRVIYQKQSFTPETTYAMIASHPKDFFPPHWIGL